MKQHRWPASLLMAVAASVAAAPLAAQLRPLEPVNWPILQEQGTFSVAIGVGVHHGQRASLAGLEGRLVEFGEVRAEWRTGRVVIEAGGTVRRFFDEYTRIAEPTGGARRAAGERLGDRGAWRIATAVRLTEEDAPALLALRFGTRLPNPDNRVGLERDQTDFFALLGGYTERAGLALGVELGLGIHGTRYPDYEQSDVLLYAGTLSYRSGFVAPRLQWMGQHDGNRRAELRGNEDLSELRAGARIGQRWWVEGDVVYGLLPFSPRTGVRLAAGTAR